MTPVPRLAAAATTLFIVGAALLAAPTPEAAGRVVTGHGTTGQAQVATPIATHRAAGAAAPCPTVHSHPWCDRSLSPDRRALLFQRAMTLAEEVRLMGGDTRTRGPHTGATYSVARLGLRPIYFSDGPSGPRQGKATAMPSPIALSATWSPALAYQHGREIGEEARAKGNDVLFAPAVNMMRTPQNGRSYEEYGEDTYLVARTAVGWIDGAQSTGVIANVKHFLANNQEGMSGVPPVTSADGGRQYVSVQVGGRALRETYLPQFEAAVKQANVGTIMCSYNRINGTYSCSDGFTIQKILERQWGFKGLVLSDYGAVKSTVSSLQHGLDFAPDNGQSDQLYSPTLINAALDSGQVTKATIDAHVRRLLRTLFAFGVFDRRGYVNSDAQIDHAAHRRTAEKIEERAITLLKNDGVLPLKPGVKRIAVIGKYADSLVIGGGSGSISAERVVTVLQGLRTRAGSHVQVTYTDGTDAAAAAAAAKAADVAVVVVGDVETEGQDKSCVSLSCNSDIVNSNGILFLQGKTCATTPCPLNNTDSDGLVSSVAAAQPNTVVVLQTGGPVLTPWRQKVAAVVESWYPGQEGGTAIARMLYGDVDPGGRLPATFPASAGQLPTAGSRAQYPGIAETVDYSEGVYIGYKWYDAHHLKPAYPFGDGLSYTTFRYGPLHVRASRGANRVAVATMDVTNTGSRAGVAVPELYISKPAAPGLTMPVRQLVGFSSVTVPKGRTVQVSFPLDDRSFASWGGRDWVVTSGCYSLAAGSSSRSLPVHTTIARGSGCAHAALRLSPSSHFFLPLPAPATSRLDPR